MLTIRKELNQNTRKNSTHLVRLPEATYRAKFSFQYSCQCDSRLCNENPTYLNGYLEGKYSVP